MPTLRLIARLPLTCAIAATAVFLTGALSGCGGFLAPPPFDDRKWMADSDQMPADTLYAEHYRNGRYDNPWRPNEKTFFTFLRWKFSRPSRDYPNPPGNPVRVVANDGSYLKRKGEPPSITSVGHATFVIQTDGQVWVTDPMFSNRALWPKRKIPPGLPVTAIPEDSMAVISHNHYDHLDVASIRAMPASTRWFVPRGLKKFFLSYGIDQVEELDWWESVRVGDSTLVCLPAQHWSNRLFTGRNSTLWASWLLVTPTRKIYFGGDSGYFGGFKEIGRRYGPIDEAILPIGAYEPRWFMAYSHLNIDEALRAFEDLRARRMIPMQYGVFKLGEEPADFPVYELEQSLLTRPDLAAKVLVPAAGERIRLGQGPD